MEFHTLREQREKEEKKSMWVSDRRLYLNADKSSVVEEGDPEARFLLAGEGAEVPDEVAEAYGLKHKSAPKAKTVTETVSEDDQHGDEDPSNPPKALAQAANKARKRAPNK